MIKNFIEFCEQASKDQKINNMLDSSGMLLFFKKDKEIFGTGEDGRVVFARIKNPDKEDVGWEKEATFAAFNLSKILQGEKSSVVFGHKDLEEIKVISKEEAVKKLSKIEDTEDVKIKVGQGDFEPDNFIKTMEQ